MTIWQIINLTISNTGIYKDCDVFIWQWLILVNLLKSPISPNKLSLIINRFTVNVSKFSNWQINESQVFEHQIQLASQQLIWQRSLLFPHNTYWSNMLQITHILIHLQQTRPNPSMSENVTMQQDYSSVYMVYIGIHPCINLVHNYVRAWMREAGRLTHL